MVCSAYFGELTESRKTRWKNDDTNPYGVLVSPISLEHKGHDLLIIGSKYFHDRKRLGSSSRLYKQKVGYLWENTTVLYTESDR